MFNWFNMKKKSLPQQVLENTKDIEKLYDQELSDITQLNYKQDAEDSLTYADGKATFKGKMSIIRNENTQNLVVDSDIEINISSGDDDIIIDAGEDNVSLKIRLDNETRNKINRALLTPITTPSEREFVAVGTNNSQIMIPESEIINKINSKELLYNTTNSINIEESVLSTLDEYFDLFNLDKNISYKVPVGYLENNNFKALVGTPSGFSNYAMCEIKLEVNSSSNGNRTCYKLLALDSLGTKMALGYIYKRTIGVVFSGWSIIGG